jgi:hypothetical protein
MRRRRRHRSADTLEAIQDDLIILNVVVLVKQIEPTFNVSNIVGRISGKTSFLKLTGT